MTEPEPLWRLKARYDGADYDLVHLRPLDRIMVSQRSERIGLCFRFSAHCCTDKQGHRDLGSRIRDEARPEEERYFCPVRWYHSRDLPALVKGLDSARVVPMAGFQWVHSVRCSGISNPWVVWMKVMPGQPGGPMIVSVESAYLAGRPPQSKETQPFRFVVEQTYRSGKLFGIPSKGRR